MIIYRIQDKGGRGPFRPGFSHTWLDELKQGTERLKPWPVQFPEILGYMQKFKPLHCGCGCISPEQLRMWFSESEVKRLARWGYEAVELSVDLILAQSDVQLVFQRSKPLRIDAVPFPLYVLK